ncbi:LysR family transcriptional regulator [Paenibacillus lutrae]|uniref:LysR family transcriptional regulator n=1 Tax=Paenibacillus lutrae TaxID=2078573 RepID=A0A7X3K181_9BACL|nr:LysR family transcriptional regulator [Paenibacillus lutrae]MVP01840.1 LysR family transcriptional regulator [Paenibacillus lutrae]
MNLEQLTYIVEVARCGSFTKAAQNCHITVTGISRSVSFLEQELGIRIFSRSRSGTVVTTEGNMIITKARGILNQIHELKSEAESYSEINHSKIRIATIPGPISLLIHVLIGLRKEFPRIQLEISEHGTDAVLEQVRMNISDIGFVLLNEDNLPRNEGLVFERLVKGNIVLGVSAHSPLASLPSVSLDNLAGLPFVLYNDPYIIDFIKDLNDSVDVLFTSNNIEAILKAVKEDMAVTLGPDYSFRANTMYENGDVITLPLEMPSRKISYLWSVTSKENQSSKAAGIFVNRVVNMLQQNG